MPPLTRRSFLKSACAGAAAFAAAPALRTAQAAVISAEGMKFGLVTYLWAEDWDLPTLLRNCEQTEVLGVELRTTHAHGVEPSLSAAERQDVRKRFADSPVACVGMGSDERFDNPDPARLAEAIEATKRFIQLSHDIGASGVKVKPDRFHPDVPRERTIEQIGRALNTVGAYAADYGQEVRLEVHGQCAPLPIIAQIMEIADHPSVVVCWNSNPQDLEGDGLAHNFGLVKDRFGRTAHIHALNEGIYPYAELFRLFAGMEYDGWLLLEAGGMPEDPVAALAEQRKLFDALKAAL